jgi:predicted MPP superfamily phosphohydrolase
MRKQTDSLQIPAAGPSQRTAAGTPGAGRRLWTRRRVLGLAAAGAGAGVLADAIWWEPHRLVVERLSLAFPDLPPALNGLRLVHLTDLHCSVAVSPGEIERAVAQANALAPDLVLLTGDYVTIGSQYAALCAAALSALQAPLGRYAVLGNHDHWAGAEKVVGPMREAGVRVLRNEALPVSRGGELWLAGIDSAFEGRHDIRGALQGVPPAAFKVVLLHEPDLADEVARHPVQLQLSGHSHGGQVRLPGFGAPILPRLGRKYPMGLRQVGGLKLYTNRGVGRLPPAIRLNCPPEVALITLRRA